LYRVGFTFAWEIDLWGKYRRATEAAQAQLLATEEVRQAVAISLVSSVAQTYLQLRELDLELQITRGTLATRQETARIVGVLYRNGLTNELDLRQAEGAVAATAAALPDLERAIAQTENALSLLVGQYPGPIARGFELKDFTVPPGFLFAEAKSGVVAVMGSLEQASAINMIPKTPASSARRAASVACGSAFYHDRTPPTPIRSSRSVVSVAGLQPFDIREILAPPSSTFVPDQVFSG
jgi:hypothetical protein